MQIKSLHLQNFRSHADTTLELAPLTIIRGSNAVGKSSLEKAIELAVAAHTDETTSDGKGSSVLIRSGQTKAIVELQFLDNSHIRGIKMALNGSGRSVVPMFADQQYLDNLAQHKAVFSCLTNNRFFVDLSEDKQKDILSAIILPKSYDWPAWVKESAADLGLKIDFAKTPFDVIVDGYRAAFDMRRDVNRDLKNLRIPEGDTAAADQLDAIRERLAERNKELEELVRKDAERTAAARTAADQLKAAKQRRDDAQGRIAREESAIKQAENDVLSKDAIKKMQGIAKEAAQAAEIDEARINLEGRIAAAKEAIKALGKLEANSECPTCKQSIGEKHLKVAFQALDDKRRELESLHSGNVASRKQLGNPAAAKEDIARHERATGDIERSRQRIKDDQSIVKDAERKIAEFESKTEHIVVDEKIADIKDRITKGNEVLAKAQAATVLRGQQARAKDDQKALSLRQSALEKLVAYFGDDIRNELLQGSIGDFERRMNQVLSAWGYECQLSIEPYAFTLAFRDGSLQLKCLSKSQRYRFAAAFQVALASVTGFKFVIIDEADIFTAKEKAALNKALLGAIADGTIEQAIVLGSDERTEVPQIPNAAFYMLRDVAEAGSIPRTKVERLGA